ncbi:conjugation TrbI family protein [Anaeromyxobacter dehalogenans 2CP-1]|uniref:Conjugation TrbI family protein n=1 Tax=Anaeromyxobacter dehalogenans (strain ATCC BAA-258 / DSM 21875 / 2CP-1) TaxID=455488 RepID=B8JFQ1_ANAD2|nr:type IV secretion system protein VirB10 [Anaeromyxobacter dehalogenans]ACL64489.1 conjugation TrbI family protein [Anaeromyxobacter dehalogenans 2CP-1]
MAETIVDAAVELEKRERERARAEEAAPDVEGARGKALLAGARRQWPVGARTFFVVTGLVAVGLISVLLLKARSARREAEAREHESPAKTERVERHVPPLELAAQAPVPLQAPPAAVAVGAGGDAPGAIASPEAELVQRRLSRGFGAGEGDGGPREQASSAAPHQSLAPDGAPAVPRRPGGLEEKLEAVELRAAAADVLPDRDHILTQGAMLDCVLETRIVSTVAGMTSCHLTRDVYSTSGRVVLLDRGSRVVGRYQGGMQQGDTRVFVLWMRVETPAGVVVELQSPGAGPLGEAGLGGHVDTRFWDRFGAAVLLSVIEDGVDAAAARAAGTAQGTSINVGNTANAGKEVIARSMEPTINIPPLLVKNQGERVGIFVARDLDFRSVYGLERFTRTGR